MNNHSVDLAIYICICFFFTKFRLNCGYSPFSKFCYHRIISLFVCSAGAWVLGADVGTSLGQVASLLFYGNFCFLSQ